MTRPPLPFSVRHAMLSYDPPPLRSSPPASRDASPRAMSQMLRKIGKYGRVTVIPRSAISIYGSRALGATTAGASSNGSTNSPPPSRVSKPREVRGDPATRSRGRPIRKRSDRSERRCEEKDRETVQRALILPRFAGYRIHTSSCGLLCLNVACAMLESGAAFDPSSAAQKPA